MKFGKKFFIVLGLVGILASLFATTAFAADTRVVRYAEVIKVKMLDNQPASFMLLGDITCDKVQFNSSVSGKTISIYAYDVKIKYTGVGCGASKSFKRAINVGTLVPGTYTVLINPDGTGKAQKKFTFIAPMLPATATPAAAKP
jgi:hypothetical protein